MLHVAPENDATSKGKIEPFITKLFKKYQSGFYPFQEVCIDEMVIPYRGRWKYKQYNPNKPSKYHIKMYGFCDSTTGYCYNALAYMGSETSYSNKDLFGDSEKIFEHLMQPLHKGHHIYADRFYTTYNLVMYLLDNQFYYTGTVQSNRKHFPAEIKQGNKMKHMETQHFRSDNGLMVVMWKDKKAKKPVILTSTKFCKNDIDVTNKNGEVTCKPEAIHYYNMSMNGCDRSDQLIS